MTNSNSSFSVTPLISSLKIPTTHISELFLTFIKKTYFFVSILTFIIGGEEGI